MRIGDFGLEIPESEKIVCNEFERALTEYYESDELVYGNY